MDLLTVPKKIFLGDYMWVFVILAVIVAGYQAIQHYNAASRYEHVPFFPFMLKHHPLVTIGTVIAFGFLVVMAFN